MYDSLMEHFLVQPCKKMLSKNDVEVNMSSCTSENSSLKLSDPIWSPTTKELWILITCAVSSLVVALDATILVPVLPTLAVELNGTAIETFWTGTAYLLSHAVLQPFLATLSDIFNRRELLVPSIFLFALGSVLCGIANDFILMLVGRVVQGIGGAGIIALSQIIFADLVPLRQRPKYFTMVLGAWAVGSLLGPLIGGLFVERATWRWCFWLNLPTCGIALPMAIFFLGNLSRPPGDLLEKLRTVDWIGNVLFITSITWFLIAISWAGIQFEWSDWQTVVPLVTGTIGILVTIAYETYLAPKPFLRREIFANMSAIASYVAAMLQGLALYMALYYVSFYFTATHFFGAVRSGTSLFPATAFMLPGSAVVSALITRFGKFRWAIWTGFVISTLSAGLYIIWDENTPTIVWAICESLFGLGMGMLLSSVNFSIQAAVAPEDAGQAAVVYAFVRSIGMAIGVSIGGTVFQNEMKRKLESFNVSQAAEIARNAEGFIHELRKMATNGQAGRIRSHIMDGYVAGFRGVWITMTVLCGAGLLASLLVKKGNLDKVLKTKVHVRVDGDGR